MADPAVVLVHGAFADASDFRGLYDALLNEDVTVTAPPNPLRGLSGSDGDRDRASHVAMISHPKEVADVVMTAVRTCATQPA
jgi:hypothetical protein